MEMSKCYVQNTVKSYKDKRNISQIDLGLGLNNI